MERARTIRLLRIAAALACLAFCSVFVVLWVRSYQWIDNFTVLVSNSRTVTFHSGLGKLAIDSSRDHNATWQFSGPGRVVIDSSRDHNAAWYFSPERRWRYSRHAARDIVQRMEKNLGVTRGSQPILGFRRLPNGPGHDRWHLFVRHWIPVFVTGLLAALLGIRRPFNFSLRTLLLATTWIAVVMGMVVAFRR